MAFDLNTAYKSVEDDINSVEAWCNNIYDKNFKKYFADIKNLHKRLEDRDKPITDEELSFILIDIPLNLIDVAEIVSSMRVSQETLKLRNKSDKLTDPEEKMYRQLLASAYTYVINRVEREISFSRELIMGAKKIWDSRRRTDSTNPVGPIDSGDRGGPSSLTSLGNYIK